MKHIFCISEDHNWIIIAKKFILNSSKTPRESNGTGNYIEARDTSITWLHAWTDILSTTVTFADGADSYAGDARDDDRRSYSIAASYDWRRWITLGASFSFQDRESSDSTFDYDKNVFQINVDMSL